MAAMTAAPPDTPRYLPRRSSPNGSHHDISVDIALTEPGLTRAWASTRSPRELERLAAAAGSRFRRGNVLTDDNPRDAHVVDRLIDLALERHSRYLPVRLTCRTTSTIIDAELSHRRSPFRCLRGRRPAS